MLDAETKRYVDRQLAQLKKELLAAISSTVSTATARSVKDVKSYSDSLSSTLNEKILDAIAECKQYTDEAVNPPQSET